MSNTANTQSGTSPGALSSTTGSTTETDPFAPIELTPKQKQQWEETMTMMGWTAPGFRHLFYRLLINNNGEYGAVFTRDIPVAATDGFNILVNPDTFFGYSLPERVYIMCHEVVHNIYDDVRLLHRAAASNKVSMNDGTTLPFNNGTMQKSMDFRINALLTESRLGKQPKDALHDLKIAKPNDMVLDVYKRVYEDDQQNGGGQGFDKLLPPGKSQGKQPDAAAAQRNPQQWAVEVAKAQTLEQMKSQGKMPGALQRMFKELLEPEIPWTEKIRGICARKMGTGGYNWRRPDRRFIVRDIYLPSKSAKGAGWVVCWGDTSGSIGSRELESYLGELSGIIEDCRPTRLTVIWCDAKIQRVDELEDASDLLHIKRKGAPGGGGTSVHPVFDWISKHSHDKPEMFIGFTDGCVTFPSKAPTYPVIWASTTDQKYPWGDVVRINTKAKRQ